MWVAPGTVSLPWSIAGLGPFPSNVFTKTKISSTLARQCKLNERIDL